MRRDYLTDIDDISIASCPKCGGSTMERSGHFSCNDCGWSDCEYDGFEIE